MQTTVKLYTLGYTEVRTYWAASLFVLGNLILPQLFHLMPQGGITWLPIYFFTLIGAYKYGWKVGLLTALLSPTINSLMFGMPSSLVLPAVLIKSVLLALTAGYAAYRFKKVSVWFLLCIVLSYQIVGTLAEWIYTGNLYTALQDFRIGVPGILMQVFGGWLFINYLIRK